MRNKIIVYDLNYLGDLVMSSPVYRAIKQYSPNMEVHCFCFEDTRAVPERNPYIDKIITTGRGRLSQVWNALKLRGYLASIHLNTSLWTNFLMWLGHAEMRQGYSYRFKGRFLTIRVPIQHKTARHGNRVRECLNVLGYMGMDDKMIFDVRVETMHEVKTFLQMKGIDKGDFVVGVHCCCRREDYEKRFWYEDRWAAIADWLVHEFDAHVIFTGTTSDGPYIRDVMRLMENPHRCIDTSGILTLKETAALLDYLNLFLTVNTSVMHIAAARDVPTVALIGGTPASVVAKETDRFKFVEDEGLKDYNPETGEYKPNMASITVDKVKKQVETLLHG